MTPYPVGKPGRRTTSLGLRWIAARLAPLAVVGALFTVSLTGMDLAQGDRYGLAAVGFGLLGLIAAGGAH